MPTTKKTAAQGSVMDVSKPKGTPAIVRHPTLQATSAPTDAPSEAMPETAPALKPTKKVVIQPLHDHIDVDEDRQEPPSASTPEASLSAAEPEAISEASEKVPETAPDSIVESVDKNTTEATTKTVDPVAPTTAAEPEAPAKKSDDTADVDSEHPTTDDAALRAQQEHREQIQKMVDSEQYFLPIKTVQQRATRRALLIGIPLIIILGLAWVDAALDAGLLSNTYDLPHTSFFSVK